MNTHFLKIAGVACLLAGTSSAQNKIVLKDGTVLKDARFRTMHGQLVEYESQGSLHDVELEKINWIEKETPDKWTCQADGTLKESESTQDKWNASPKETWTNYPVSKDSLAVQQVVVENKPDAIRSDINLLDAKFYSKDDFGKSKLYLKDGAIITAFVSGINNNMLEYEVFSHAYEVGLNEVNCVEHNGNKWVPTKDGKLVLNNDVKLNNSFDTIMTTPGTTSWDLSPGSFPGNIGRVKKAAYAFNEGRMDAKEDFHSPGTTLLGFISLPVLFIPPIGTTLALIANTANISSADPTKHTQIKDPEYLRGYKKGMRDKKLNNTLGGAGLCIGTTLAIIIVALAMF